MGVIKEVSTSLGTIYDRYDNNGEVIQRAGTIGFSKNKEGFTYFILTDLRGNKIKEANLYLNNELRESKYKKRELAFTALKLLYSFLDLNRITSYKYGLDEVIVSKLLQFLQGGNYKGFNWNQEFNTTRSNKTVNNYLGVYREYFTIIFNVENSAIHKTQIIGNLRGNGTMLGHSVKERVESYKANNSVKPNVKVPKYIKPLQYELILKEIEENYALRDRVIVELMYRFGLRIGEVLGLTLEDIVEGSGNTSGLFIRNRLQDKPWQRGKGLHTPNSFLGYRADDYKGEGKGYHFILIDDQMLELLQEYIDESRDEFFLNKYEIKRKNLAEKGRADKLTDLEMEGADVVENQYVFLSHQHYTPLTAAGWNCTLREVFNKVGIKVDNEKKKNSLSHRFRHGFAMVRAHQMNYTHIKLAAALRHKSITTVMKYYNPDEKDKAELLSAQRERANKGGYSFE